MDSKEIKPVSPEYPLEGLTLKLKLQNFGHLMQRADSLEKTLMVLTSAAHILEKTLMLGKIEGGRGRG